MWVDQLNRVLVGRYRIQGELGHNGFAVYLPTISSTIARWRSG
jgi:hypothetical protein